MTLTSPLQLSSPCRYADHLPSACARRKGDGLALVLHTQGGPGALGGSGGGLGYAGLPGGLAVELDAWSDEAAGDPGDDHVSVQSRGPGMLRSDHAGAGLGHASAGLVLGDGRSHTLRVRYTPTLGGDAVGSPAFRATPLAAHSLGFGGGLWPEPAPLGALWIWLDEADGPQVGSSAWAAAGPEGALAQAEAGQGGRPPPLLIVPLRLDVVLQRGIPCESAAAGAAAGGGAACSTGTPPPPPPSPPSPPPPVAGQPLQPAACCPPGTAWVGITASTGASVGAWEVLSWGLWSSPPMGAAEPITPLLNGSLRVV